MLFVKILLKISHKNSTHEKLVESNKMKNKFSWNITYSSCRNQFKTVFREMIKSPTAQCTALKSVPA